MVETNNLDRTKSKHLTTRVSFAFTGLSAPYLGRILGFGSTPPIIANLCLGLSKPIRATRLGNLPLCGSPGGGGGGFHGHFEGARQNRVAWMALIRTATVKAEPSHVQRYEE